MGKEAITGITATADKYSAAPRALYSVVEKKKESLSTCEGPNRGSYGKRCWGMKGGRVGRGERLFYPLGKEDKKKSVSLGVSSTFRGRRGGGLRRIRSLENQNVEREGTKRGL